jgi:hypothetical protein
MQQPVEAPEETAGSRILTIEADVVALEKMRKEGRSGGFTVYCDEGPRVGGEGSAPPPLRYLGLAVGF